MTNSVGPSTANHCTAFNGVRQLASGSYAEVATAIKAHLGSDPGVRVLVFDDRSGAAIDFDLRGSDRDIAARIDERFAAAPAPGPRTTGRPRLGVVSREVTLLPRHWEWLAAQPSGASAAIRRLIEDASRSTQNDRAILKQIQERVYRFMSAMAGDLPGFEEASRALFANKIDDMETRMAAWPEDIRGHIIRLFEAEPVRAT